MVEYRAGQDKHQGPLSQGVRPRKLAPSTSSGKKDVPIHSRRGSYLQLRYASPSSTRPRLSTETHPRREYSSSFSSQTIPRPPPNGLYGKHTPVPTRQLPSKGHESKSCRHVHPPPPSHSPASLTHSNPTGNATIGAIPVTPDLLSLLHFLRTNVTVAHASPDPLSLSARAFGVTLHTLADACHGYAWLSTVASYHAACTSSPAMKVLQARYYDLAIRGLREAMRDGGWGGKVGRVSVALTLLGGAEYCKRDREAGLYHARYGRGLLAPREGRGDGVMASLRHSFLLIELERAMARFERPLVDVRAWVRWDDERAEGWPETVLGRCPEEDARVDCEAVGDGELVRLMVKLMYLDGLLEKAKEPENVDWPTTFQLSLVFYELASELLCYSIDAYETVITESARPEEILSVAQRAAAALATLYYMRLRTHTELSLQSDGPGAQSRLIMQRFFAQGPRIAQRIEVMLRRSQEAAADLIDARSVASPALSIDLEEEAFELDNFTIPLKTPPRTPPSPLVEAPDSDLKFLEPSIRLRLWILHVAAAIERTAEYGANRRPTCHRDALMQLLIQTGLDGSEHAEQRRKILARFPGAQTHDSNSEQRVAEDEDFDADTNADEQHDVSKTAEDECAGGRWQGALDWFNPVLRLWGLPAFALRAEDAVPDRLPSSSAAGSVIPWGGPRRP